jgi:sigma-B regulation protein RsbU (phosphoserine phosphatase)
MNKTAELQRVVAREASIRIIAEHATLAQCRIGIYAADGSALFAQGDLAVARPSGLNGHLRIAGLEGPASVSAVTAFDRHLGYVVACGNSDDRRQDAPDEVAAHAAAVLGELCAREYEIDDLSQEILGSYEELNLFYDLSAELAGARDADAICRVVLAKARRVIDAKDGWILLTDGPRGALRVAAANEVPLVNRIVPAGLGRAGAALATRVAASVDDVRLFDGPTFSDLERRAQRSLLTVPLCVPGDDPRPAIGVLQLRDSKEGVFSSGHVKLAQAIASQAAVAIQNARLLDLERELKVARTIQESLLPGKPPALPGMDIAGACVAASNVGGDYYDHILVGRDSLAVLVADVSGHNLASALLQTAARGALRAVAPRGASPGEVLRRASIALHDDLSHAELFITVWLGRIDAETGTLYYSDAGHNPAILYRPRTRETLHLSTGGPPIGVLEDATFDEGEVALEPGDVVVAYTDGLTEAWGDRQDEMYGEERLAAAIERFAHLSAKDMVAALQDDVARFCGERPPGDDRTLMVVRRLPAAVPALVAH